MKDWITDNIMFRLSTEQIMAKHEQHYYEQDPFRESRTHNRFFLPHDIHNAMDTYVSLEYKCDWDVATSVKLWANANPDKMFFFNKK
jgi:hypothetical protein